METYWTIRDWYAVRSVLALING
eukprot:SAG11_NODE_32555_length_282_cov_1.688525_1_plen_22_part_10